jgi:hypothetical protein
MDVGGSLTLVGHASAAVDDCWGTARCASTEFVRLFVWFSVLGSII